MKSKEDLRLGQRVLLAAALFSFTSTLFAAAPVVSNVRASQRAGTQRVDVYYDVADAHSATVTVSIAVSTNGCVACFSPGASVSGTASDDTVPTRAEMNAAFPRVTCPMFFARNLPEI